MEKIEIYTVEQVAEMFSVQASTVRGWLRNGKMPGRKFESLWRVTADDIKKFIDDSKVEID